MNQFSNELHQLMTVSLCRSIASVLRAGIHLDHCTSSAAREDYCQPSDEPTDAAAAPRPVQPPREAGHANHHTSLCDFLHPGNSHRHLRILRRGVENTFGGTHRQHSGGSRLTVQFYHLHVDNEIIQTSVEEVIPETAQEGGCRYPEHTNRSECSMISRLN